MFYHNKLEWKSSVVLMGDRQVGYCTARSLSVCVCEREMDKCFSPKSPVEHSSVYI